MQINVKPTRAIVTIGNGDRHSYIEPGAITVHEIDTDDAEGSHYGQPLLVAVERYLDANTRWTEAEKARFKRWTQEPRVGGYFVASDDTEDDVACVVLV